MENMKKIYNVFKQIVNNDKKIRKEEKAGNGSGLFAFK
jgi:hypothetical protein